MKLRRAILFTLAFGFIAFALIGIFNPQLFERIFDRDQRATTEIRSLIPVPDRPDGRVRVCKYRVWATEEARRPVKFGNFETQHITDRYQQDKPQEELYPGKFMPSDDVLLKILDPQEKGAKVVAIVSKELIKGSCKFYRFE